MDIKRVKKKLLVLLFLMMRAELLGLPKKAPQKEEGDLVGIALEEFSDPQSEDPLRKYGVCVFALLKGDSDDNYERELIGPLGKSSKNYSRIVKRKPYGKDTWGQFQQYQYGVNPNITALLNRLPEGTTLIFAGVMCPEEGIWGPASNFFFKRKK